MRCAGLRGMAGPHQWVRLLADDFSATVSASSITSHQGSHLANLLELGQSAEVRLDCDAATAKEVTAVLRQGASYVPPTDAKLVAAAQHQLNYLGIPWQQDRVVPGEEVVWVPHYQLSAPPEQYEPGSTGLLIYSKAARGWANITGQQDPFKASRAGVNQEGHSNYYSYLAGVLRAEATGAGEVCSVMPGLLDPAMAGHTAGHGIGTALQISSQKRGARAVAVNTHDVASCQSIFCSSWMLLLVLEVSPCS